MKRHENDSRQRKGRYLLSGEEEMWCKENMTVGPRGGESFLRAASKLGRDPLREQREQAFFGPWKQALRVKN